MANEMNFYTLNGTQYEIADKKAREQFANAGNSFAPAIPVTMTGPAVSTDMVSPVEHDVRCRVESKNRVNEIKPGYIYSNGKFSKHGAYRTAMAHVKSGKVTLSTDSELIYVRYGLNGINHDMHNPVIDHYELDLPEDGLLYFVVSTDFDESPFTVEPKIQIEQGTIKTPYTPYIPDLSAVTVSQYCGNLIDVSTAQVVNGTLISVSGRTVDASGNEGGFPGSSLASSGRILYNYDRTIFLPAGIELTVEFDYQVLENPFNAPFNSILAGLFGKAGGEATSSIYDVEASGTRYHISRKVTTDKSDDYYAVLSLNSKKVRVTNFTVSISPGVDYVSAIYSEPVTFKPNAEGIVTGMRSVAPNMTILTDNAGATIEATYNADTKKYIDSKFTELQALALDLKGGM